MSTHYAEKPALVSSSSPRWLYGTAWKEERTEELTALALQVGFRGLDTANQRKHYFEAAVGAAIAGACARGLVARGELFIQTKFTFRAGQDHRLPYDPSAPISHQVAQSFESSLEHLRTHYLDSYLLHAPSTRRGLVSADLEAWRAMENLLEGGRVRQLGISNVSVQQLEPLCRQAKHPPTFVQNRCYASTGWDAECRDFCRAHGIVYQGFSLLTANRRELQSSGVTRLAQRLGATVPQLVFRFALQLGILPLTGTTREEHMSADLNCEQFALTPDDLQLLLRVGRQT